MASTAKDIAGKSLAIFFPIMAFVISGFEHCVANMYYIPAGIFASMNADYVAKAKELYGITESQIASLNWENFFLVNLLPVTIGNIYRRWIYHWRLIFLSSRKELQIKIKNCN